MVAVLPFIVSMQKEMNLLLTGMNTTNRNCLTIFLHCLTKKMLQDGENNQLTDEDNCRRFRTTYDDKGNEVIDEDEIFDENEDLIPLDVDEYFDDHETTKLVLEGDENEMTIHRSEAGHNFSKCLKKPCEIDRIRRQMPKDNH